MGILTLDEIIKATGGRILCGKQREFTGLSIDSRTIKTGELFVALRGAKFDGHDFVHDALREGAGAIVNAPPAAPVNGKVIIYVNNTLAALQDIARHLRFRLNVPVVGITGTNGKTTTKELISSILGESYKVLKTSGNLNNHIGLPLCISRMDGDETIMVLEMGSNAQGDIRQLCEIAHPDIAVVTNVGPAHLEGFGSIEMVRDTDLEILEYVKVVSVNADDGFLVEGIKNFMGKTTTFGIENIADVYAGDIILKEKGTSFSLCFRDGRDVRIDLGIPGRFNVYNALAASSVADGLGIDIGIIKKGIESFRGVPMRIEIKELPGVLVISDVYNANPASMEEALKELARLKRQRMIAVLGDMLELGRYAEEAHKKLIRHLSEMNIDVLIATGPEMVRASSGFPGICHKAQNSAEAGAILSDICAEGDTVLVKGSRGMRMEMALRDLETVRGKHAL
ncbi:MAG: UDP-N-acetylmuramoyl-tripeptide--D-alanyl-D-alanine ligase [Nitrospirota bacterium]